MTLRPARNKILVRAIIPNDVSDGGIALPVDRKGDPKDNPDRGEVLYIGECDGVMLDYKVGDIVLFTDFWTSSTGIKANYIVDMKDVAAVLEGGVTFADQEVTKEA